jgi:hypothetical protein
MPEKDRNIYQSIKDNAASQERPSKQVEEDKHRTRKDAERRDGPRK